MYAYRPHCISQEEKVKHHEHYKHAAQASNLPCLLGAFAPVCRAVRCEARTCRVDRMADTSADVITVAAASVCRAPWLTSASEEASNAC